MLSKLAFSLFAIVLAVIASSLMLMTVSAQSPTYDPQLAWTSLWYAKVSSCRNAAAIGNWSCGPSCDHFPNFQIKGVYTNKTLNDLSFTGYDPDRNVIVASFQGSEDFEEWMTDFDFTQVQYPFAPAGCLVHKGFFEEWNSYASRVLNDIAALRQEHPGAEAVSCVGHSLGGGASLHAGLAIVRQMQASNMTEIPVKIYNFGEPRAGNPAFAAWATTTGLPGRHEQFRVTHAADPVPHLPPMKLGDTHWLHVPREVWYNNNGNTSYKVCTGNGEKEDPHCSDSTIPIAVWDHTLYLGECTGCKCDHEEKSRQRLRFAKLRKNPKWLKMMKYVMAEKEMQLKNKL